MLLSTARTWVRRAARDGMDETTNPNADIDRAIQHAGNEFCRSTRAIKKAEDVTLTASSATFPLTTPIANGFRPDRIIDVCLTSPAQAEPLSIVEYYEFNRARADDTGSTTTPTLLSFSDWTHGEVYPVPDQTYTAKLRYWLPFTSWDPGAETSVTLNVPDDLLIPILSYGAVAVLEGPTVEKKYTSAAWERFQTFMQQVVGAGSFGAKSISRQADWPTRVPVRVIRET